MAPPTDKELLKVPPIVLTCLGKGLRMAGRGSECYGSSNTPVESVPVYGSNPHQNPPTDPFADREAKPEKYSLHVQGHFQSRGPKLPNLGSPSQSPSFLNSLGLRDPYQPHVQGLSPVRSQRMGPLMTSNSTEAQTDTCINQFGLVHFQLSV